MYTNYGFQLVKLAFHVETKAGKEHTSIIVDINVKRHGCRKKLSYVNELFRQQIRK